MFVVQLEGLIVVSHYSKVHYMQKETIGKAQLSKNKTQIWSLRFRLTILILLLQIVLNWLLVY